MKGINESNQSKHGKGYIGHFINISNLINQSTTNQQIIQDYCIENKGKKNK
jgi:hypothetical protein